MTGMIRFCVATLPGKLLLCLCALTASIPHAHAESFPPVAGIEPTPLSHSLSATTAKDRPPKQYGAYQSLEPFPRTRPNRGIEFANDSVVEPDLTNPEPLFGHTIRTESARDAIQQTQYPLDEESPATIQTNIIEQPRTLPWVAPLLAVPGSLTAPLESNWLHMSGVNVDATHVVGTGNYLGITTLSAGVVLETPSFQPFSIRPNIGWHTLHGPRRTDLPSQLYDVSIEMRMYWPFGDRWLGEFAIAPGLYTDFQNTNSDALRIVGRAVGYYRWSPDLQLAVGAAYLDRQDVVAVPVAGLVWTPTPDDRFEILVPRPRFAHRFRKCDNHERWAYIAGEFGGGSWAIERTTGADDIATYRDFRLITGIEFKFDDKSSWRVEGGYVFGRELEYDSNLGNYQPGDTALVRAALRF